MTVNELISALDLEAVCLADAERPVWGGYCGDMLSWVMGRAGENCAWITIMSNVNVVAVAVMAEASAVILAEGVRPDEGTVAKAKEQGVTLLCSDRTAFNLAGEAYALLKHSV